jgi:hypothetical protein
MMKGFGDLLKQAQEIQGKMGELHERLEAMEVEGVSGGGMIRVVMTGKGLVKSLSIDPSLVKPEDAEVLEDLIVAAHNDAKAKCEARVADEMNAVTGGLPLPPGMKLF